MRFQSQTIIIFITLEEGMEIHIHAGAIALAASAKQSLARQNPRDREGATSEGMASLWDRVTR